MTRPAVIYFGPDGPPSQGAAVKVFLRTLLYSTAKRAQIVENMYVTLRRGESVQTLNIWVYGDSKPLLRGSGLRVSEDGFASDHHFVRSGDVSARPARPDRRELQNREDHAGRSVPPNIPLGNRGRTLRISNSARFNAIAKPSSIGHSRNVEDSERPPESKTCLGSGLKWPPVNRETERNRKSFEP